MSMDKENFLQETINALKEEGKTPEDVRFVYNKHTDAMGSWEDFSKLADFEYSNGYGMQEISSTLVIVGPDWWFERGEYDGSEWWEFKKQPQPCSHDHPKLTIKDMY